MRLPNISPASRFDPSWSSRYSSSARCGSTEIAYSPSTSSVSCGPTPSRWKARDIRSWRATSQTIVRLPARAAASPKAAATVVFPTPPLPVTKTNRLSKSADTPEGFSPRHTNRHADGDSRPHARGPTGAQPERGAGARRDTDDATGNRLCQSEGRRRQDHDDAQPGSGVRREGAPRPLRGHGPAGQPDDEPG